MGQILPSEIKRILHEILPHKKKLIVVAIAGIIVSLCSISVPILAREIGKAMEAQDFQRLLEIAGMFLVLYAVMGTARYFHIYLMNYVGELAVQGIRAKLQKKFMSLNLTFHNTFVSGSGGLLSRILNDITTIQNGLRMFADFFREPLVLIGVIGYLFWLNWKLTLGIFIIFPILLTVLRKISKTIKSQSIRGQEELERITSTIKESLDGVRVIQSFNLEDEMAKRFHRESFEYLDARRRLHQRVEISGPISEFVAVLAGLTITIYIGYEISQGRASFGDFMGYLGGLLGLSAPIKKLQESYVRIQETSVAAHRAYKIMDDPNEVPLSKSQKPFPKDWKTITYKNVSFAYGTELILKSVNLTIHRGEMVAFVGASGSGKSTIVNLLERFFDPTSGEILIDQTPIQDINLKELRANIALVTQDVFLFSDSIERNIWAGDFSKPSQGVQAAAQSANAHNFISKTPNGYQNRVGDRGNLLSGGEKQRVSIARAIFKDAPLLILDEATSALDSQSEVEVQKGIDQLMKGRTALVIAHRLSTVARADKIVVMRAGEIVETGTHQSLLEQAGEYHSLHQLQKL